MGAAAMVFTGISAIVGAYSSYSGAQAQAQSAYNSAAVAQYNAKVAETNAQIARAEGAEEQYLAAQEAYRERGRLAAAQAQAGILGSATGESVSAYQKSQAEETKLSIQRQSYQQSAGYLSEASQYRQQASMYKSQAKQYSGAGWISGLGSLATGASSAYGLNAKLGTTNIIKIG